MPSDRAAAAAATAFSRLKRPRSRGGHGRALRLCEQTPLRLEVLVHRPVEIEVLGRQVREDQHGEPRPLEPPERRRVGGRLDHRSVVARIDHLPEQPLEVDRLGRVQPRREDGLPHAALDVPEQPGPAAGLDEDRVEQVRGRRLAVRPRDPDHVELRARVAEEERRGGRHRAAHTGDDELGHPERERPLHDERGGTVGDGLGREVVPVGGMARHAEEERAGRRRPGVEAELGDLDRSRIHDLGRAESLGEALQVHRGPSLSWRQVVRGLRSVDVGLQYLWARDRRRIPVLPGMWRRGRRGSAHARGAEGRLDPLL